MRLTLTVALLGLAAGCAHGQQTNDTMADWINHPITEVVSAWGPPVQAIPNGTGSVYQWINTRPTHVVRAGSTYVASTHECREWFDVDASGTIRDYHFRGWCE
jgi:hypothetical protein